MNEFDRTLRALLLRSDGKEFVSRLPTPYSDRPRLAASVARGAIKIDAAKDLVVLTPDFKA